MCLCLSQLLILDQCQCNFIAPKEKISALDT